MSAVLAGVGLAAVPSAAQAQTISVPCGDTPALIEAIGTANAAPKARIRLGRSCNYDLTAAFAQETPSATRGPNGLPIITGDVTIDGRGSTIRRTASEQFRILEVGPGAVFRATGLGISGGDAGSNTGGGILNARGRVLLTASGVSGNTADNGAGISNDSGDLRLVLSTVSNNRTAGGGGGGIYSDGFLLIDRSRLIGNQANTHGGALFTELGARVVLSRSDIIGNRAVLGSGGGLYNGAGGIVQGDRVRSASNQAGTGGSDSPRDARGVSAQAESERSGGGVHNAGRVGSVAFTRSVHQNNTDGDGAPGNDNCHPAGDVPGCRG